MTSTVQATVPRRRLRTAWPPVRRILVGGGLALAYVLGWALMLALLVLGWSAPYQ